MEPDRPDHDADAPPGAENETPTKVPRWVPVLVASILVIMAGLAVYTGMRYRRSPFEDTTAPQRTDERREEVGAPGEPVAGASRVLPGETGENAPAASNEPFPQSSRIAIRGDAAGVQPTYRATVRRGVQFKVEPAEALFYVNNQLIGPVSQFSSEEEVYEFPEEGNFTVRLEAPGRQTLICMITVDPEAADEVARIDAKMAVGEKVES